MKLQLYSGIVVIIMGSPAPFLAFPWLCLQNSALAFRMNHLRVISGIVNMNIFQNTYVYAYQVRDAFFYFYFCIEFFKKTENQ